MLNWDASSNHVLDEYFDSLGPLSITQHLSRPKQKVNVIAPFEAATERPKIAMNDSPLRVDHSHFAQCG